MQGTSLRLCLRSSPTHVHAYRAMFRRPGSATPIPLDNAGERVWWLQFADKEWKSTNVKTLQETVPLGALLIALRTKPDADRHRHDDADASAPTLGLAPGLSQSRSGKKINKTKSLSLLSIAALFAHIQACLPTIRRLQAHTAAAAPRARPARRPARQTRNRTRRPARNTRTHRAHRKPRANQRRRRTRRPARNTRNHRAHRKPRANQRRRSSRRSTARNTTGLQRAHTKRNANPKRAAHPATRTHTHRPFRRCILRRAVRGRRARRVGQ